MAESTPANNSGKLKYADPRTLPSYPSSGLKPDGAAAGAAATLGWQNQKTVELWKPDKLSSASAAAVLAKDYKPAPQWQPGSSPAGHKAALLAAGSAGLVSKDQLNPNTRGQHDGWGNSAATQAFHARRQLSTQSNDISHGNRAAVQAFSSTRLTSEYSSLAPRLSAAQEDRSLLAAKGAIASSRPRATSVPARPEISSGPHLESSAASSALNGAAVAHRASVRGKSPSNDTGAVPVTTMTRNMFTSRPLVKPEVDEKQSTERLHQSAIEMAKKMYHQQQKTADQSKAQSREASEISTHALNLQDAAYRKAQERLSKLYDEQFPSHEMQEYYGNSTNMPRRRWTVTNKSRRTISDKEFDDHQESAKIRKQMSIFSKQLTEVDHTKRQKDRDDLLAAAQRNVKARLHGMDEKVYDKNGKVNPKVLIDWESKAYEVAQTRHETRGVHDGELNLGGGMYMSQDAIEAIAANRIQPVLDNINKKAEDERERLAALKLEEESKKAELEREREREREMKQIQKRIRGEDKQDQRARRMQEKEEEKSRKEREKLEKAEQKKMVKEGKRKTKFGSDDIVDIDRKEHSNGQDDEPDGESSKTPDQISREEESVYESRKAVETRVAGTAAATEQKIDHGQSSDEPTSPGSKVKGWFRNRLSMSKPLSDKRNKVDDAPDTEESALEDKQSGRKILFGRSSTLKKIPDPSSSATSLEHGQPSIRDVTMAGKSEEVGEGPELDSRGVSPVSSKANDKEVWREEDHNTGVEMLAPKPIKENPARSSMSPNRDSRFREEMDS